MMLKLLVLIAIISAVLGFSPSSGTLTGRKSSLSMGYAFGINGFGRIGRLVARIMVEDPNSKLLAINTGADTNYIAYQFKYDTVHGRWKGSCEVDGTALVINGQRIETTAHRNPTEIPWKSLGVEYLCESTGVFLTAESAKAHVDAGAKKVIFSAPAKDKSPTIVMGVNDGEYTPDMTYVSCASCTTNGLAPVVKAIHDKFGIEEALMTTVHAMTSTQMVVDGSSKKDWRGGRGASSNIIPSTTGAAKAVAAAIPSLKGKITGMAFRVPTADVSVVDLTAKLSTETTYEDICAEIRHRASTDMKGILGFTDEALVSSDFITCPISSVFDAKAGIMLSPKFVKVVAWYDNEWGYSNRVVDLMVHMAKKDGAKQL
jgi:glyceraldehyde 3-phosphate dehydrogenase